MSSQDESAEIVEAYSTVYALSPPSSTPSRVDRTMPSLVEIHITVAIAGTFTFSTVVSVCEQLPNTIIRCSVHHLGVHNHV